MQIVQSQAVQHLQRRAQLSLAAVDNDKARQILVILVAAVDNLLHRLEIVRLALGRNNLVLAVILLADAAVTKDDHRSNRLTALRMTDIEAIHALQGLRHAQRPLQLLCCLLVILQRQAALAQTLVEQLHSIIRRQLQQLTLHAALRL